MSTQMESQTRGDQSAADAILRTEVIRCQAFTIACGSDRHRLATITLPAAGGASGAQQCFLFQN